ncbi:MAG: RsiG family protein [Actinomycetota bacterium]
MERIKKLLDPSYIASLDTRDIEALRAMKAQCTDIELAVSYNRRLAQARIEILEAEHARRDGGGSLEDLVADLPRILGAEPGRSAAGSARVADADSPSIELRWPDGREDLITNTTLANLPGLDDTDLDGTTERLREFERELSSLRHDLHEVIDVIEREIAARQVAGTA